LIHDHHADQTAPHPSTESASKTDNNAGPACIHLEAKTLTGGYRSSYSGAGVISHTPMKPVEASIVAPSGDTAQPSNQTAPQKVESIPTPMPQPHPVAMQKPAPSVAKPVMPNPASTPVATSAVNNVSHAPVANTTTGSDRAITLPSASTEGSEGSVSNAKTAASAALAAPPPSSSGVGNSSSPPRFGVAYLNNPAPKYPSSARRMGEEGKVLLRVLVSADGLAKQVLLRASSGSDVLDDSAQAAVRKWRFIPAKLNGDTVEAWVQVPIVFKLDN
jgi:protein TonB